MFIQFQNYKPHLQHDKNQGNEREPIYIYIYITRLVDIYVL